MEQPGSEPDRVSEGEVRDRNVEEAFRDGTPIDRALGRAVREAFRMHKRLGNPIAVSQDGRVTWITPDHIQIDE